MSPNDFCIIDYTETIFDDGRVVIDITNVECFYFGGDGSGYSGGGGTTSGGSYAGNNADGAVRAAVNSALDVATMKLSNTQCANLVFTLTNAQGACLIDIMYSRQFTSVIDYIGRGISYGNGQYHADTYGSYPCAGGGDYAWVPAPGLPSVWVCDSFTSIGSSQGAIYLIHEMLHTLGLEEGRNNLSSQQITNMVNNACS